MGLVAHIIQMAGKPGFSDGPCYLFIRLSHQIDLQSLSEAVICCALTCEHVPQHRRVAVCCEKPGVCDREIPVGASCGIHILLRFEVALIKSVCDEPDRRPGHRLELLLHKGRDSHDACCIIQHLLLHPVMPPLGGLGHRQMLEVEYLCPRVTEIRYPRKSGLACKFPAYEVHGLRRTCTYYQVHRMIREVFLQESDRRADPCASRVRAEEVAAYPHRHLLEQ